MNCATYLGCYVRKRLHFGDRVYDDVAIIRFECQRLQPDVPAGSHRTFSLLPCPLIPYHSYTIPLSLEIAQTLTQQQGHASQTAHLVAQRFFEANPERATVLRLGRVIHAAMDKLDHMAATFEVLGWHRCPKAFPERLADFIRFVQRYRSQELQEHGICALCYDYFYRFQNQRLYMQRDFLFGTPSQKCV
jgi:hypothetical protein